jgi:hypothetical protein
MKNRIDDFVLGSMTPDERAAMELARRFDPELDQGIKDAEDSMAALSIAAGELAPSPGLWNRIRSAIDEQDEAMENRTLVELGEGDWQPVEPGIDSKSLWNDRTTLLRCAPGAIMPGHSHDDDEHLLVLAGDLIIGNRSFMAGDYIRSRRGFDRFIHTTRNGCLLLQQLGQ